MTKNSTSPARSKWTGMVPIDDTALAVTDTGGPGIPVVYLNGQFATQGYWRRVIAELGLEWRHITYDERARGTKSKRSADYSFQAAVRDVDAVLAARGVDRAFRPDTFFSWTLSVSTILVGKRPISLTRPMASFWLATSTVPFVSFPRLSRAT